MKSIAAALFLLAFYIRLSGACIVFYGNISPARDFVARGAILEDGTQVCTWEKKLSKSDQYWLDCIAGHSAFVTKEFHTLAYTRNKQDFRIQLKFEQLSPGSDLIYGNEASCLCGGPKCAKPKRSFDIEVPKE
ncbi:hypothetical protein V492_03791 [Pseudogymnoascus sp. VKM F-4246]|nr:hypothetical protein V492_03791 [Pseudogymnoascus sp. VKM F-4246]